MCRGTERRGPGGGKEGQVVWSGCSAAWGMAGSLRVVSFGLECHAEDCGHSSLRDEEPVKAYKQVGRYFLF